MSTDDVPDTVLGTGNTKRRRYSWEVYLRSYWDSFFFLKQIMNCVAYSKTLENTDLGKVPSNIISASLTFQITG